MKYIIVGLHSSGKRDVIEVLKSYNIKCGKQFSSSLNQNDPGYSFEHDKFDINEVNKVFENNAYIFLQERPCLQTSAMKEFEGLSTHEFDENDVFVMSPDQLLKITPNAIKEPVCFVWMDNTKRNRKTRYLDQNRTYNFNEREEIEMRDSNAFIKTIYDFKNSRVLYFANEDPGRVAAVIYASIKHPELLNLFESLFV